METTRKVETKQQGIKNLSLEEPILLIPNDGDALKCSWLLAHTPHDAAWKEAFCTD